MFERNKNHCDTKEAVEKKSEQELSEVELAKVAGGVPPRAGTSGMEI